MPKQSRPDDERDMPNRAANRDPAEGPREPVDATTGDEGGGISNRPREQERENQDRLPPRGDNKEGGHA